MNTKIKIFRIVCVALTICLTNGFVLKAQNFSYQKCVQELVNNRGFVSTKEPMYKTEMENGKVISQTKYVNGSFGMGVIESVSKYTYDENGNFLKKEVVSWNKTYKRMDNGKYYPDYSEVNWIPQYCVLHSKDSISNFDTIKLLRWNKKEKAYSNLVQTMIFQMDDSEHYTYLAFLKKNKYVVQINTIDYDRTLLSKVEK